MEKKILTFEEVWHKKIFPVMAGPDFVNLMLGTDYPNNLSCGFSEEEIFAFCKTAREDFKLPEEKTLPIALVFIPSKKKNILGDEKPLDLWWLASAFKPDVVFDYTNNDDKFINEKEISRQMHKIKTRKISVMTYLKPHPLYFGRSFAEMNVIADERQEEILKLPEAFLCQIMTWLAAEEKSEFSFNSKEFGILRTTSTVYFKGHREQPNIFYFDDSGSILFFRPAEPEEERKTVPIVGKIAYL